QGEAADPGESAATETAKPEPPYVIRGPARPGVVRNSVMRAAAAASVAPKGRRPNVPVSGMPTGVSA
ncbi:hypothetical protein, partial [Streptomyces mirabilis]|uniref:hypothetical protein n=1 Tax=Streptomyces mirabilis TaxID=68239 RepID=UPI0033F1393F